MIGLSVMNKQGNKGRLTSAAKLLKRLADKAIYSQPPSAHISRLGAESDRGVILLLAAFIEDGLREMIKINLKGLQNVSEDEIFGSDKLFGTFSRLITGCLAMGIISPDLRSLIDLVRHIRNKAAHLQSEVTFSSPEVSGAVLALISTDDIEFVQEVGISVRDIFIVVAISLQQLILLSVNGGNPYLTAKMKHIDRYVNDNCCMPLHMLYQETHLFIPEDE